MRTLTTKSGSAMFAYDTVSEMVDYCHQTSRYSNYGGSFVGKMLRTWSDVRSAVFTPDVKLVEQTKEMVARLKDAALPEVKSRIRKTHFSEDRGDEVDYDRLRSGMPYWRESRREETSGPTSITIITDASASAGHSSGDIAWRGVAAIALTSILEEAGYAVELWVIEGTTPTYSRSTTRVSKKIFSAGCLKHPGETLDVTGIVNAVSGWFYRSVDFTIVKTQAANLGWQIDGVGRAYTPTEEDLDALTPDEHRIYCSEVFDFNSALEKVKAEVERITSKENR